MAQKSTIVHDSVMMEFTDTCRHCKKTADEHADGTEEAAGKCLFDSTTWDPMTQEEWVTWSRDVWVKFTQMGHTAFRTQVKQAAFAKQIAYDLLVYGSAVVHVDKTVPGNVVAVRVDPTLISEGPLVPFKFDTKKKW